MTGVSSLSGGSALVVGDTAILLVVDSTPLGVGVLILTSMINIIALVVDDTGVLIALVAEGVTLRVAIESLVVSLSPPPQTTRNTNTVRRIALNLFILLQTQTH